MTSIAPINSYQLKPEEIAEYRNYILPVLPFRDIVLRSGRGSRVWDTNDKDYIDLNSGQFCAVFGHSDLGVADVMQRVSQVLQDTDTSTLSEDILLAAKKVREITDGMDSRVLFLSTGAEAMECCLRYAKHIKEKPGIISFDRGYHGLTHGTAAYSMSRLKIRPPVDFSYAVPVPSWFSPECPSDESIAPYIQSFHDVASQYHEHIAAAVFEPIVSGGGFYFPPRNYFYAVRDICNQYGIYLIFDECQTGFGRTGKWFYYQQLGIIPDFVVSAKAMGLGFPVSCVIANGDTVPHKCFLMEHFSSHQNEPFSGALVSYLIDRILEDNLLNLNRLNGEILISQLEKLADEFCIIKRPRGIGLMCAFDLELKGDTKTTATEFCRQALAKGLILQHCNFGKTIRLLPNYLVTQDIIFEFVERLRCVLKEYDL